jgi:multiple sugar transport system permease protein
VQPAFIKTVLLLPMMLPPIAVAIVWKLMYQPQFGVINDLLIRLGLEPSLWVSGHGTAMLSLIVIDIWEWTPFVFLMCLAGLAGLPSEPYEAAEIDGAPLRSFAT